MALPLETGAVVLLQAVHPEAGRSAQISLMAADGFASTELRLHTIRDWVTDSSVDIRDCLFRLTPKLNYAAQKEYRKLFQSPASASFSRREIIARMIYRSLNPV